METTSALRRQLESGIAALGLALPPAAVSRLMIYQAELEKWNTAYNLTAIRTGGEMVTRHLLDSLALLPHVQVACAGRDGVRLLDVGAGAGLPGLVLAIADPTLHVTVLDGNGKKARFMRHATRVLALDAEVAESRVEQWQAAAYDLIVSRAFAALSDFFEGTRHLLAPGGQWLAMKGKLDAQELAAVAAHVRIRETPRLQVPGLHEDRHVVIASCLELEPQVSRS